MADTLYTALRRHSAAIPSRPFLVEQDHKVWTYADLDMITARYAIRLTELGIQRGQRLATLLHKSPQAIFLYLACVRAGIVYLPLNPALHTRELAPILEDASPAAIVCDPEAAAAVSAAPGSDSRILTLDSRGAGSFAPGTNLVPSAWQDVAVADQDLAALMFTSGTTGRPKGAMMTHRYLISKALSLTRALEWRADDVLLHAMPLFHSHGLFMTLHSVVAAGASMAFLPEFNAEQVVDALPLATVFSGVPTMYQRLLRVPALSSEVCRGMRLFVSASAALGPDTFQEFRQRTGYSIVECWGMTETMTNAASPLHGERRPGAVGPPLPGVELRVTDANGQVLPAGETGVLEVRNTSADFGGYWNRCDDTRAAVRPDGFFVTGDLGRIDDDDHVSIVGRAKDVIITGGYNVYPQEIETALREVDGVADAAVFGLPHPDFGEGVAAAVELAAGANVESRQIVSILKTRLIGYKIPKVVFVLGDLPRTTTGKIRKNALQHRYAETFSSVSSG